MFVEAPDEVTGRVLLVRRAGVSFDSEFNVRSSAFDDLLNQWDRLQGELEQIRNNLLVEIFDSVPKAPDHAARRLLLRAKRAVFNLRTVSRHDLAALDPDLQDGLRQFNGVLENLQTLPDSQRYEVFEEIRLQLDSLVADPEFRCAVDYSSPWLLKAFDSEPRTTRIFSDAERGVHAYASRYFSKANPFNVFASVSIPGSHEQETPGDCEIVLDTSAVLSLEGALLPRLRDPYRRLLSLRSFCRDSETIRFLIPGVDRTRGVSIKDSALLQRLVSFFDQQESLHSLGCCVDYLAGCFQTTEKASIEAAVTQLISAGVISEYLVRDFSWFRDDLLGISEEHDALISKLQDYHLACVPRSRLPKAHEELAGIAGSTTVALRSSGSLYYVNRYDAADLREHEAATALILDDLQALKPCFSVSTFHEHSSVARGFLLDQINASAQGRVSYTEALLVFLRQSPALLEKYHSSASAQFESEDQEVSWLRKLGASSGHLTGEALESLLTKRTSTDSDRSLCYLGSIDYKHGVFYLTQVFAGEGRYASRYLLHRGLRRYQRTVDDDDWLDVQLVAPFDRNLGFVAALLPTACGFESRYRHLFEHWIDPSGIVVELVDGRVVYRDTVSGKLLRFRLAGYMLAENLGAAYQLLLVDHADSYVNPFDIGFRQLPRDEGGEARMHRVPALHYRSVCLRREQFVYPRSAFDAVCQGDILRSTIRLREMVRMADPCRSENWYFRPFAKGFRSKPRYLDLRSPLSVQTFRKTIASLPVDAIVSLSRLEPGVDSMFRRDGSPFLTELMVEV